MAFLGKLEMKHLNRDAKVLAVRAEAHNFAKLEAFKFVCIVKTGHCLQADSAACVAQAQDFSSGKVSDFLRGQSLQKLPVGFRHNLVQRLGRYLLLSPSFYH